MDRHAYNRKLHGYGREADYDHYQYAERKIMLIMSEAMANCKAIISAYQPAFDAAFEAGAYTRPLFSSTYAVSDATCTLNIPSYPPNTSQYLLNTP